MEEGGKIPVISEPIPELHYGFYKSDEAGKKLYSQELKQYKEEARKSLEKSSGFDSSGILLGPNSFISILINQKDLLPEGEFLLSLSQFGQVFNKNRNFFRGTGQNTGIILRTKKDTVERNNYLSINLFNKLKDRGFEASPEEPIVISLTDLKLRQDKKSGYGLVYDLAESAKPIIAPAYGTEESVTKFNYYDNNGIPIPEEGGKYTICKRISGVSSISSEYDQLADSGNVHIAGFGTNGRIVVGQIVDSKNYAQVEEMINREEARRQKVKKDLEKRVAKL